MPDMRFAPPNPLRIADRASGLNAVSVKGYNERLVMSMLLQNKDITRMQIGEQSGLSAQTVSVIIRSFEQEGLIAKGEAQRGRVGPPTVPLSLNPEGAYSVGISVGHRRIEVVLVDFVGTLRFQKTISQPGKRQDSNHPEFIDAIKEAISVLPKEQRSRIAGIGLALPEGTAELQLTSSETRERLESLREEIEQEIELPVFVQNDITAAAGGESMFGAAKNLNDYLFFYLGAHLHTRLILNHQIYNTNADVSYDVGIFKLEHALKATETVSAQSMAQLWERSSQWPDFGEAETHWRAELVKQLAGSIAALTQFIPLTTIVLSSCAPQSTCRQICLDLEKAMPRIRAVTGTIAGAPKAVGAASLPYSSRFMVE
jgi:predicted NBD/HSP70 family sugar kinase/predicted DNA-binding transcriptional regulator